MSVEPQEKAKEEQRREEQERVTYESLRGEVKKRLGEVKESVSAENVRQAIDQATERLRAVGTHTAEAIDKASTAVRKDLADATRRIGPSWSALTEQRADLFAVWKDRGTAFLSQAAASAAEWLQKASEKIERTGYRTGDITYSGAFECTGCNKRTVLAHSGHLPPCHNCMGTEFRRVS